MPDRSEEFRKAAGECLELARTTSDQSTRATLLLMAQRWFELASKPPSHATFDAAVQVFNDGQMTPRRVMQQQQQIQPQEEE